MKALIDSYSVGEIIIFIIILALAIKEFISLLDWFKSRGKKYYDKQEEPQKNMNEIHEKLQRNEEDMKDLAKSQLETHQIIQQLMEKLDMLIESDKDDIKSFITKEHHYFVQQKGSIDVFSLDCIERRYKHYTDEGGNSFIKDLMKEIRELPKTKG